MALDLKAIIKAAKRTDLVMTPKVQEWLMAHGDDAYTPEIADWIAEQLKIRPRIRSGSFSASSAGACERAQVLGYLGVPGLDSIDPRLQNIFNDGKWRHLRWQAMLLTIGLLDRAEMPLHWRNKRSRGTIDGHGIVADDHPRPIWRGKDYGFELKGMNPYGYSRAVKGDPEMKEEHLKQVHRYFLMGAFDLFVIVYENKATQEWHEWVIEPDDAYLEESREELDRLNDAVDDEVLPPMLNQCKIRTGVFKDCTFGVTAQGPCPKAGTWPMLTKKNNNTNKKGKK